MAGNKVGGQRAAQTNKERYGPDFYTKIGAIGGKNGTTGGFGQGEEGCKRASIYGKMGGEKSRKPSR